MPYIYEQLNFVSDPIFRERESKVITIGKAMSALKVGTINICLDLRSEVCSMTLQNVFLVSTLPINLISLN